MDPVVFSKIVNFYDVWMADRGRGARLRDEHR